MVEAGLKVALIDSSGNYYSRRGEKSKGLTGFGGAAMRYDANLDYSNGVPETSNLGDRVFGNREIANQYINEVYKKLESFGLKNVNIEGGKGNGGSYNPNILVIVDRGILPIGERQSNTILNKIYDYLVDNGIHFFEFTDVERVVKQDDAFELTILDTKNLKKSILRSKYVILATGKLSVIKSRTIFDELGVKYSFCDAIDLGVRIETLKNTTDQITQGCVNPKIIFNQDGVITRTFCWCPGGKVIDYNFEGMCIVDGQHCHDNPTNQTNFGIVTTVKLPKNVDGTNFGINYVRTLNDYSAYRPGLQILKDFVNSKESSLEDVRKNRISPTITDYSLIDLNTLMIFDLKEKMLSLIEKINEVYPGAVSNDSLVYAPVLERVFPKINLDFNMESSVKGFFVVGDISGKAIGVITGAAMGIKAASCIISQK